MIVVASHNTALAEMQFSKSQVQHDISPLTNLEVQVFRFMQALPIVCQNYIFADPSKFQWRWLRFKIPFLSYQKPTIDLHNYIIHRICKYIAMSPSTLIYTLWLIQRLFDVDKKVFNTYTVHKIVLCAVNLAVKMNEDEYPNPKYIAACGGVTASDLYDMESYFCRKLDFRLQIPHAAYMKLFQTYFM